MILFGVRRRLLMVSAVFVAVATGANLASQAADLTALEQMRRAHDGRAEWTAFPGFEADLVSKQDGTSVRGTLKVSSEGELTLKLDREEGVEWVERALGSVMSHRLSATDAITNVEFADENVAHPLGRLIRSLDAADH